MELDTSQIDLAIQVWKRYKLEGQEFRNANRLISSSELDSQRRAAIPTILDLISSFRMGKLAFEEFKSSIDSINKKQRLWGFKGIKGMMFFNMLTNLSSNENRKSQFEAILKDVISVPQNIDDALKKITTLRLFSEELGKEQQDRRASPKIGSIPYFLSYFWQIQEPDIYPVYYTTVVNDMSDLGIWKPTGNVETDYQTYYDLMYRLLDIYTKSEDQKVTLWDIEHAFWFHNQINSPQGVINPASPSPKTKTTRATPPKEAHTRDHSESYIPPIVGIIPKLARNDSSLESIAEDAGTSIEKLFESRLAILFKMLGFTTREMGQGHGRTPDGIAICREFSYAIIYDAKARGEGYRMGTDDRAVREYISREADKLKREGLRQIYFMVISSNFTEDYDDLIREIKMETDVREILFVEAIALLQFLEEKLRDPALSLGPDGLQHLLASSGIITSEDVKEFVS